MNLALSISNRRHQASAIVSKKVPGPSSITRTFPSRNNLRRNATPDTSIIMAADDTKSKKRKRSKAVPDEENAEVVPQAEEVTKKKKKSDKSKKSRKEEEPVEEAPVEVKEMIEATEATEVEDVVEEDDQTAALLAGFESESDAEDPEEDINWDEDVEVPALTKGQRKALQKAEKAPKSNEIGVIYVGYVHNL